MAQTQVPNQVIESLRDLRSKMVGLKPEDRETIIQIGAGMEGLMAEITELPETAHQMIGLALQTLQSIFLCEFDDSDAAVCALLSGVFALEQMLGAPPNPISESMFEQALAKMQTTAALAVPSEISDEQTVPEEPFEAVTEEALEDVERQHTEEPQPPTIYEEEADIAHFSDLSEVAGFLITLDVSDVAGLRTLWHALKFFSKESAVPDARKSIVKAGRIVKKLIDGDTVGASDALSEISSLLDEANSAIRDVFGEGELHNEDHHDAEIHETVTPIDIPFDTTPEPPKEKPVLALPADADRALLSEFIIESGEYIEAAESALLALETEPDDLENVNIVFRAFHTVKGTSAFLGLAYLSELAHHAESLFSRIRDKEIRCTGGYADLALRSVDVIKAILFSIESALNGGELSLPTQYDDLFRVLSDPEKHGVTGEAQAIQKQDQVSSTPVNTEVEAPKQQKNQASDSSVRIRTDRLDRLIEMVGELVIAQAMLTQDETVVGGAYFELSRKISHAGKIVRELQDLSMAMRMIPLKNTFQKTARVVRDVAQKCGKQVEFLVEGDDTEIDRNMVDIIADPLVHMARNAVDHGIERPVEREMDGKSTVGRVRLSAYHSGGDVVVELADDGKGLDAEKILQKAISLGLVESEKGLSETQIFNLIFAPGFSTAEQVTDVSGRGVGMDVVRRNIEAMRGRIEITSEKGKGSLFRIRLPLTLAITDGMLVRIGTERFIVPTINIHLSFQPTRSMVSSVTGKGELVSLRGELMPVFRLHELFHVQDATTDLTEGLLMIVADGRKRCALLVDELLGQQQVVAKTLGEGLGKIPGVSGGAILGDGCVGLILDTAEIVGLARLGNIDRKEEPAIAA